MQFHAISLLIFRFHEICLVEGRVARPVRRASSLIATPTFGAMPASSALGMVHVAPGSKVSSHIIEGGGICVSVSVCKGGRSVGAASGLSGETEERTRDIKRCEERAMEIAESRRGYVYGAAWDEGNMIQAMARLKTPTIAWRYGDG